jgi:uncharacterized protein YgiM (DUF1202 family)
MSNFKLTQTQKIIVLTIPILLLGYFIYAEIKKGKNKGGGTTPPDANCDAYKKYKITLTDGSLNIRPNPSTTQDPIGSLENGAIVYAKPSSTAGWLEYTTECKAVDGYISEQYTTLV